MDRLASTSLLRKKIVPAADFVVVGLFEALLFGEARDEDGIAIGTE